MITYLPKKPRYISWNISYYIADAANKQANIAYFSIVNIYRHAIIQ